MSMAVLLTYDWVFFLENLERNPGGTRTEGFLGGKPWAVSGEKPDWIFFFFENQERNPGKRQSSDHIK